MWVQYNYIVDYKQSKMQTVYKPYNKFFRRQHQEESELGKKKNTKLITIILCSVNVGLCAPESNRKIGRSHRSGGNAIEHIVPSVAENHSQR